MDAGTVCTALCTALNGISTLRKFDTFPDNPQPPCVIAYPETIDYAYTFDGASGTYVLRVLGPSTESRGGQQQMWSYLASSGGSSIPALIHGTTLSGAVSSALVQNSRNHGTFQPSGSQVRYYSAELVVEIFA